jgi:hypothetical protein
MPDGLTHNIPEVVGRFTIAVEAARLLGGARAVVGSSVQYARYVHEGTRPHTIYPRSKQALYWKGAASPVASVNHPGTRPNPFLTDALEDAKHTITGHLQAAFDAVFGGAAAHTAVDGLQKAGLAVQAAGMRRAPVRTGTLRRSLHTEIFGRT